MIDFQAISDTASLLGRCEAVLKTLDLEQLPSSTAKSVQVILADIEELVGDNNPQERSDAGTT